VNPWCRDLDIAVRNYNDLPHSATKQSPRQLLFLTRDEYVHLAAAGRNKGGDEELVDPSLSSSSSRGVADTQLEAAESQASSPPSAGERGEGPPKAATAAALSIQQRFASATGAQEETVRKRKLLATAAAATEARALPPPALGDLVLLLHEKPPPPHRDKLELPHSGPFKVVAVDSKSNSYQLADVRSGDILYTRHISALAPYFEDPQTPAKYVAAMGDLHFDVEKIESHRGSGKNLEFLVKWEGSEQRDWVPRANFARKHDLLRAYCKKKGIKQI
jgi:hypothetical protein